MITYDDKVSTVSNPLPRINKVVDLDMNEIKSEVNALISRILTIDGVSYDLSANRSWTTSGGIDKFPFVYNVLDYGLVADGTTDNSAALAALVTLVSAGSTLFFPVGSYNFASTVSIGKIINIRGDGALSRLTMSADTVMIDYTSCDYVIISDISFFNVKSGTPTSASVGLKVTTASGWVLDNVVFSGFYTNMSCINVVWFTHNRVFHIGYVNTALSRVNSGSYVDSGDDSLVSCEFVPYLYNATYSFFQQNGGGTKITNCKFNYTNAGGGTTYKAQYHYYYNGAGQTVDLQIGNNSFENYSVAAIRIGLSSGTFSQVSIIGNDIGGTSTGSTKGVIVSGIDIVNITGNVFRNIASGTTVAIDLTNVNDVKVDNVYSGWTTNVATAGSNTNIFTNLETGLLSPSNDDIIQRKSGVWTNRTIAQLATDLVVFNAGHTPVFTGFTGAVTSTFRYCQIGKLVFCYCTASGTSNLGTFTLTLPVAAANTVAQTGTAQIVNSGTNAIGLIVTTVNSTTLNVYRDAVGTAFTSSGTKAANFIFIYESV